MSRSTILMLALVLACPAGMVLAADDCIIPETTPEPTQHGVTPPDRAPEVQGPGWLGIAFEAAGTGRQLVSHVIPKSAAAAAGFRKGDVITAINGVSLFQARKAEDAWTALHSGDRVVCTVERRGETLEIEATLGKMPEWLVPARQHETRSMEERVDEVAVMANP